MVVVGRARSGGRTSSGGKATPGKEHLTVAISQAASASGKVPNLTASGKAPNLTASGTTATICGKGKAIKLLSMPV